MSGEEPCARRTFSQEVFGKPVLSCAGVRILSNPGLMEDLTPRSRSCRAITIVGKTKAPVLTVLTLLK